MVIDFLEAIMLVVPCATVLGNSLDFFAISKAIKKKIEILKSLMWDKYLKGLWSLDTTIQPSILYNNDNPLDISGNAMSRL